MFFYNLHLILYMLQVKIGGDEMQYGAEKNIYDLKDLIMEYLDNPSQRYKKYKFNQLRSKMCGELGYRVDMLRVALEELELEGKIEVDKTKGLFRSFPHDLGYVHGILSINKHDEGFIMGRDGKKYKIKTEDLNDALDGDTVVVFKTAEASNGQIIVALIGDDATVKTFYNEGDHIRLQPENKTMKPIITKELTVLGRVIACIRNY